jgi:uncharacterized OB-fold protein
MFAIFLYETIGLWGVGVIAAFGIYQLFRTLNRGRAPGVRCLACGETLASTARECKYCGSARFTVN